MEQGLLMLFTPHKAFRDKVQDVKLLNELFPRMTNLH